MDYRLAVLLAVFIPLILMIWAFVQKVEPIERLLTIYWRVACLLTITVYLMIAQLPISFLTSIGALVLIPTSLWFWEDLNEEIQDRRGALRLAFTAWRWAISLYCALGAVAQLFFLNCAFSKTAIAAPSCQVWLEAPFLFKQVLHSGTRVGTLGFWAIAALIVYLGFLLYFVFFRLSRQGRSAAGM